MLAEGSNEASDKTQTGKPANQKPRNHHLRLRALQKQTLDLWQRNALNVEWT